MHSSTPPLHPPQAAIGDRLPYACLRATGVLLFLAAALKAWDVSTDPDWHATGASHAAEKVAILQYEVLLSLWLLSGWFPLGSSFIAALTFLCFSIVNCYQGLVNEPSCGCFGRAQLSPWIALVLDVAVFSMNAAAFRQLRRKAASFDARKLSLEARQAFRKALRVGVGVSLIVAALAIAGIAITGSPRALLASLRGEYASAAPALINLGRGEPGESRDATIDLYNWSDHSITFLGSQDDCACWLTRDLPIVVPAGQVQRVRAQLHFPPSPRKFHRTVRLLTNDPAARSVFVRIVGDCVERDAGSKDHGTGNMD